MKNKCLLIFLFTLLSIAQLYAGKYEKKPHFEFAVNKKTVVELENKFGDIIIKNWDKNLIAVDVIITSHENSLKESKAKVFDKIDIDASTNDKSNIITIKTNLAKISSKQEFSIDYLVSAPSYLKMKIQNEFGDVIVDKINTSSEVSVKFGELNVSKFLKVNGGNVAEVFLESAKNCNIKDAENIHLTIKNSEIEILNAKLIDVYSRFSKMDIDHVGKLELNSKYDDFDIAELDSLIVKHGDFTDFKIEMLNKLIDLKQNFGSLRIDHIDKDFDLIDIFNNYGNMKINISPEMRCMFNLENEGGNVDIDEDIIGIISKIDKDGKITIKAKALQCEKDSTAKKIIIKGKCGNIKLDDK